MSHQPSRGHFLQTTAAALAALILPRSLFARNPDKSFFFLHADTGNSWPVANPVAWSLEHAHDPILERASEGLLKLTPSDGDRIVRLVVRRCRLNLLEIHPEQIVVHQWGQQRADLRPFFKAHRLARQEIEVALIDRKREITTTKPGDEFLYGDRLATDFPHDLFMSKWASRLSTEADDLQTAPGTWSGFAWEGIEDGGRIPWAALKSAWRRTAPGSCLNCDGSTILVNFGLRPVGMFNRTPNFVSVCSKCRRSYRDDSVKDVGPGSRETLMKGFGPTPRSYGVGERRCKDEPYHPQNRLFSWATSQGVTMFTFIKLKWLELKLTGEFGQQTKYRRLCLERNATTTTEKLRIAQEVLLGGATGVAECQAHTIYLKEHDKA